MSQPWERQEDENNKPEPMHWLSRFELYRLMGTERSLLGAFNLFLAENSRKKRNSVPSSWNLAFKKWNWKKRAEAWDLYQHAELLKLEEQFRTEMLRRHIEAAMQWQKKALAWLESHDIEDGSTALRAWKEALGEERKARGLPEWLMELAILSDDELLNQYDRLLAEIRGNTEGSQKEGPEP